MMLARVIIVDSAVGERAEQQAPPAFGVSEAQCGGYSHAKRRALALDVRRLLGS